MCSQVITAFICACVALGATDGVKPERAIRACDAIERLAPKYKFDPVEVAAIAFRESRFDPAAKGSLNERGLMQVMPQYVPYSAAELHTVDGGIKGGLHALARWRHLHPSRFWACYASGNSCFEARALRRARQDFAWFLRQHIKLAKFHRATGGQP